MKKTTLTLLTLIALLAIATGAIAEKDTDAKLKALEKRLQNLELKSNKSKILWSGDLRVEAHSITGKTADYHDGMELQALTVNSLFAVGGGHVGMPTTPGEAATFVEDVNNAIMANYADYLYFTNGLTFDALGQMLGQFTPEQQAGLMALLKPHTFTTSSTPPACV